MDSLSYTIVPVMWSNSLPTDNPPVLTYKITYPRFCPDQSCESFDKINAYYVDQAKAFYHSLKDAVAVYADAGFLPPPTYTYEAVFDYETPFYNNQIASIYTEQYQYLGGAHGNTTRSSKTWDLETGEPIPLTRFFPDTDIVVAQVLAQIEQQIQNGNNIYFEDYQKLVPQYFNPTNYYLTPYGIVIYFQQYEIGPYVSGIIEFILPKKIETDASV